ncbi:putative beta-lysine N-acetyltransferase [Brevibacillus humidisoli]|uniref:putative beta-lysine N-acetyltransferase n=1 Tax=Brevibacillus humidisoli TaxID=2895522 RepID=UPI001E494632|nr:putative beta-lysine N-acetyltransferase [Brevibacillus humidisoli]UFJ43115.1 putative beta-lysine N-acetyltransferase [Brevibacillus humidisoli]
MSTPDQARQMDGQQWIVDEPNQRIRVLRYDRARLRELHDYLGELAEEKCLTKLIVYAKKADLPVWEELGYRREGVIDGFFQGENAQMMSRFLTDERASSSAVELADEIIHISLQKAEAPANQTMPVGYRLRDGVEADAEALAQLYRMVFPVYPTPMDDPAYIRKTMREHTHYCVVEADGKIVSAASAEVTPAFGSAEMTDCATHPDYAGRGLLQPLFFALEEKLQAMGIYYLYTLTRAQSHGMNITAAKMGYTYRGRLINNCVIFSGFEDMNIWVKSFRPTWE